MAWACEKLKKKLEKRFGENYAVYAIYAIYAIYATTGKLFFLIQLHFLLSSSV